MQLLRLWRLFKPRVPNGRTLNFIGFLGKRLNFPFLGGWGNGMAHVYAKQESRQQSISGGLGLQSALRALRCYIQ